MNSKDALCFIAARGGSKRFKRKNLAVLEGKPVLGHVLSAARDSNAFRRIVVSSEDAEILDLAESYGVQTDRRPDHLASDTASVASTLQEFLTRDQGTEPNVSCIYPTAVLLRAEDIRAAKACFEERTNASSLIAVSGFNLHPWQALYADASGSLVPYFKDIYLKRSQEFPDLCADTGTIYFVRRALFLQTPNFYLAPVVPFKVPELSFVDINFPEDLDKARSLLALRKSP